MVQKLDGSCLILITSSFSIMLNLLFFIKVNLSLYLNMRVFELLKWRFVLDGSQFSIVPLNSKKARSGYN